MADVDVLMSVAGPVLAGYLGDSDVTDIVCNDNGTCFVTSLTHGKQEVEHPDFPLVDYPEMPVLDRFLAVAADAAGTVWGPLAPRLSLALEDLGWRVQAMSPPMCPAPLMALRKHPRRVFTLEELEAQGIFSRAQTDVLRQAVADGLRICIAGNVGSGKTTILNSLLDLLAPSLKRAIIIADDPEAICGMRDTARYWRVKDGSMSLRQLAQDALRMNGDLVIVEEVRGGEALDMLKLFQTGHSGMTTLHVDEPEHALLRLEQLTQEVAAAPDRVLIGQVIDLVVAMRRDGVRRCCAGIVKVEGWDVQAGCYVQRRVA